MIVFCRSVFQNHAYANNVFRWERVTSYSEGRAMMKKNKNKLENKTLIELKKKKITLYSKPCPASITHRTVYDMYSFYYYRRYLSIKPPPSIAPKG